MTRTNEIQALRKRVEELEAERDAARHELWMTSLALGVIAKWPRLHFNRTYVEDWAIRCVKILRRWNWSGSDAALTVQGVKAISKSRLSTLRALEETTRG